MKCIRCGKRRKTKKGLCKFCRKEESAMKPFQGLPENQMDGMVEDLKSDLKK